MLAMMIVLGLLGSAFLFDVFDGEGSNQNVETPPEDETGQVLSYDGSYLLEGTQGDDTLAAGQDDELAPGEINLLDGDDIATVDSVPYISGGEGNDVITATGVQSTLNGGAGNDTLTADDSNHLIGGDGDDVLNFIHGSYDQGEWGSADGGEGDDTINVRTDAFVLLASNPMLVGLRLPEAADQMKSTSRMSLTTTSTSQPLTESWAAL